MLKPFPQSFRFGVGNSDHQTESYDANREDIRDVWDRMQQNAVRGRATDFWNRYSEDIRLARGMGCTMFRFSVSWQRVEPAPGQFDAQALDHYRAVVEEIVRAGMEPMVTLHHLTWPIHVEDRGGMIADEFPAVFSTYAARIAAALGPQVTYWITFNEPTVLTYGYTKPWWEPDYMFPPGLPPGTSAFEQMRAVGKLMRNLFLAHTAAREVIRACNPKAKVAANPSLLGLPTWLQKFVDRHVRRLRSMEEVESAGRHYVEGYILRQGDVDIVISALTVTKARAEEVDFTEPYYVASQGVVVAARSRHEKLEDLRGARVAVIRGSTAEPLASSLLPEPRVLALRNQDTVRQALAQGRADAFLSDDTVLDGLTKRFPGQFRLIARGLYDEPYAAAVTKGNPELLELVDEVVRWFKSATEWAGSYQRHYPGEPIPPVRRRFSQRTAEPGPPATPLPPARKGTLLRSIQDRGFLKAAVRSDLPGFSYRNPDTKRLEGVEIDLARAIARFIFADPESVRFVEVETRQRIPRLRSFLRFLEPILRPLAVFTTLLSANWWHLGIGGKLPEFLCPADCVGKQDFIGFDYYWGFGTLKIWRILGLLEAISKGRYDLAPVWPKGLYVLLVNHARWFPKQEIIVVENGCVEQARGIPRHTYLRLHLQQVQRALSEGVPVTHYVVWTIASNFEWGFQPAPSCDFGLYHIDLLGDPTLSRKRTAAADAYTQMIRDRTAVEGRREGTA